MESRGDALHILHACFWEAKATSYHATWVKGSTNTTDSPPTTATLPEQQVLQVGVAGRVRVQKVFVFGELVVLVNHPWQTPC